MVSIRWPHCIIREQLPVNTFFKEKNLLFSGILYIITEARHVFLFR